MEIYKKMCTKTFINATRLLNNEQQADDKPVAKVVVQKYNYMYKQTTVPF